VAALVGFAGVLPFAVPTVNVLAPNTDNVARLLSYGVPATLLVLVLSLIDNKFFGKYFLLGVKLGDASYSVYLFHPFVVALFARLFSLWPYTVRAVAGLAPILCLLGVLVVCHQIYCRVELPLQRRVKELVSPAG
jgi:peptidoglycan/LPS O-acetylase OafA/YrhL